MFCPFPVKCLYYESNTKSAVVRGHYVTAHKLSNAVFVLGIVYFIHDFPTFEEQKCSNSATKNKNLHLVLFTEVLGFTEINKLQNNENANSKSFAIQFLL